MKGDEITARKGRGVGSQKTLRLRLGRENLEYRNRLDDEVRKDDEED